MGKKPQWVVERGVLNAIRIKKHFKISNTDRVISEKSKPFVSLIDFSIYISCACTKCPNIAPSTFLYVFFLWKPLVLTLEVTTKVQSESLKDLFPARAEASGFVPYQFETLVVSLSDGCFHTKYTRYPVLKRLRDPSPFHNYIL